MIILIDVAITRVSIIFYLLQSNYPSLETSFNQVKVLDICFVNFCFEALKSFFDDPMLKIERELNIVTN